MKQHRPAFLYVRQPSMGAKRGPKPILKCDLAARTESRAEKAGSRGTYVFVSVCAQSAFALAARQNRRTHI